MRRVPVILLSVAAAVALAVSGYFLGRSTGPFLASNRSSSSAAAASGADGRKVLYWHDPMVRGPRFDKPGKSPFMDMALVPMYADRADADDADATGDSGVRVSPTVQQNLGIRTAVARRMDVSSSFDAVGRVEFDERRNVAVQSRVAGYVEQLAVRATMERVHQGQALATLFAPEWLAPQNELLALQRAGVTQELIDAARNRLRAMSIPDALVRQSEATGAAQARYTLYAPVGGVVAELGVQEGVAVVPGMTLFRIAGLDKVWAVADVPESQAVRLKRGQSVAAVLQADPGQSFKGALTEILPQVSATTRTLQARFEVDNRDGRLVPGMLLRLQVGGPTTARLVVPAEAVIRTGMRTVAIVRKDNGRFEPRDVQLGVDLGDTVEVVQGIAEGDQVVASGQFLVDSEARLMSVLGAMTTSPPAASSVPTPAASASAPSPAAPSAVVHVIHVGEGKVESVDAAGITISHGPIASMQWPAMTMGFAKSTPQAFADTRPGDTVRFGFRLGGATGYELVSVQRVGGRP